MIASFLLDTLSRYFSEWNLILIIIVLCSIFAMAIFVERLTHLRKAEVDTSRFIISLRKVIEEQNIVEAVRICEDTGGAIAQIIRAALLRYNRPKDDIEAAIELSALSQIAALEKNAKVLSIIAHITPLIGLLGTVLGFIQAFSEMRASGLMDISANRIGAAMEYALVTTAAGLVVAIPCVVAYNYLVSRIKHIVLDIQITSSEIVELLTRKAYDEI